jgi:hypothetical protein
MKNLIITTPEELKAILSKAVANVVPQTSNSKELPDSITLETAVQFYRNAIAMQGNLQENIEQLL